MVIVAQLVRAPGCGPGGRGFESLLSPHFFCLDSSNDAFFPLVSSPLTVQKQHKKTGFVSALSSGKKINRLHFLIKVTPKIYSLLCLLFSRAGNHLSRAHAAKEIRIGFPERPENQSLLFWGLTFNRPYFSDEEAIKSRLQMPAKDSVQQFLAVDQHRTNTA